MKKSLLLLVLIVPVFFNCRRAVREEVADLVVVPVDIDRNDPVPMSFLFDSIRLVALEGTDDSYFVRVTKMIVNDDHIYVKDANSLYHFDENGNFIANSKGRHGRGPKEYFILMDFLVEDRNIVALDAYGTVFTYDSLFNYVGQMDVPLEEAIIYSKVSHLTDDLYLLTNKGRNGTVWQFYSKGQGKLVKTQVNVQETDAGIGAGYLPSLQKNNRGIYYRYTAFNPNIAMVDTVNLEVVDRYRYDFGKYNFYDFYTMESARRGSAREYVFEHKDRYAFLNQTFINDRFVFARIKHLGDPKRSKISLLWFPGNEQLTVNDVFEGHERIFMIDYIDNDALYSVFNFYDDIMDFIDPALLDPKSQEILDNLNDDTNAVVVKYYFKESLKNPPSN